MYFLYLYYITRNLHYMLYIFVIFLCYILQVFVLYFLHFLNISITSLYYFGRIIIHIYILYFYKYYSCYVYYLCMRIFNWTQFSTHIVVFHIPVVLLQKAVKCPGMCRTAPLKIYVSLLISIFSGILLSNIPPG